MKNLMLSDYDSACGLRVLQSTRNSPYAFCTNIWRKRAPAQGPCLFTGCSRAPSRDPLDLFPLPPVLQAMTLAILDHGDPILAPFLLALLNETRTRPIFLKALQD